MYFDDGHMDAGWGITAMVVMMLLFLVVIGLGVLAAVLVARGGPSPSKATPAISTLAAEEILAERLARGEIDATEYAERMQALTTQHRRA
ncbi:conserved hypothetical protein [metagenome]|uniref:SHOCT domain-containing protein n=1 Tax=metagenome TaxID=256318 RepID=A0A2P2C6E7_9ZZZZ